MRLLIETVQAGRATRSAVASSVLLLSMCVPAFGQEPLPPDMAAAFNPSTNYAERMYLPTPNPAAIVRLDLRFSNFASNKVDLHWVFQEPGAYSGVLDQSRDVSFNPTAIARRAGSTNEFFVVGWVPRTSRVIVEKWSIAPLTLTTTVPPTGAAPRTGLSEPVITATFEWISPANSMAPIWDAGCYPYADELWLLESGPVTRVHALNLSTLQLSEKYSSDAAGMGSLAGHRSLTVGKHPSAGFIIISTRKRPWDSMKYQGPSSPVLISIDIGSNGLLDVTTFDTQGMLVQLFPPPWDEHYLE